MRRCISAVVLSVVVVSVGATLGKDQAPPSVPQKVEAALERMVGTWNVKGDPGEDGIGLQGQTTVAWSSGRHYLIVNSHYRIGELDTYDHGIIGWDGQSEDGIIGFRKAPIGFHEMYFIKVVSETVNEGTTNAVGVGKRSKGKLRAVWQGPDRAVWNFTEQTTEAQLHSDWKVVYTRADNAGDIEGMWELEKESHGEYIDLEKYRALKVYHNGTFFVTYYDRKSGQVEATVGGTYSFDGRTLNETVTFAGGKDADLILGQSPMYRIEFKDGKIHQTGQLFGIELDQLWCPVAK